MQTSVRSKTSKRRLPLGLRGQNEPSGQNKPRSGCAELARDFRQSQSIDDDSVEQCSSLKNFQSPRSTRTSTEHTPPVGSRRNGQHELSACKKSRDTDRASQNFRNDSGQLADISLGVPEVPCIGKCLAASLAVDEWLDPSLAVCCRQSTYPTDHSLCCLPLHLKPCHHLMARRTKVLCSLFGGYRRSSLSAVIQGIASLQDASHETQDPHRPLQATI